MDCHMPEMDGLTATRTLRQRDGHASLPIVALTASAMKEEADACLEAGMSDFLAKPLKLGLLVDVLRRHVGP
jgi:CheY-like chemotaxis protein